MRKLLALLDRRLALTSIALAVCTFPSHSETMVLSDLDREAEVYLQRSNTGQNMECYWHVVDLMLANGTATTSDLYVVFDEPSIDGLAVGALGAGSYYTCEHGVLRSWDGGQSTEIRTFE